MNVCEQTKIRLETSWRTVKTTFRMSKTPIRYVYSPGQWYSYFYDSKNPEQRVYYDNVQRHFSLWYSSLPADQRQGKIYDFLGVPNIFGKIMKAKLRRLYVKENAAILRKRSEITPSKPKPRGSATPFSRARSPLKVYKFFKSKNNRSRRNILETVVLPKHAQFPNSREDLYSEDEYVVESSFQSKTKRRKIPLRSSRTTYVESDEDMFKKTTYPQAKDECAGPSRRDDMVIEEDARPDRRIKEDSARQDVRFSTSPPVTLQDSDCDMFEEESVSFSPEAPDVQPDPQRDTPEEASPQEAHCRPIIPSQNVSQAEPARSEIAEEDTTGIIDTSLSNAFISKSAKKKVDFANVEYFFFSNTTHSLTTNSSSDLVRRSGSSYTQPANNQIVEMCNSDDSVDNNDYDTGVLSPCFDSQSPQSVTLESSKPNDDCSMPLPSEMGSNGNYSLVSTPVRNVELPLESASTLNVMPAGFELVPRSNKSSQHSELGTLSQTSTATEYFSAQVMVDMTCPKALETVQGFCNNILQVVGSQNATEIPANLHGLEWQKIQLPQESETPNSPDNVPASASDFEAMNVDPTSGEQPESVVSPSEADSLPRSHMEEECGLTQEVDEMKLESLEEKGSGAPLVIEEPCPHLETNEERARQNGNIVRKKVESNVTSKTEFKGAGMLTTDTPKGNKRLPLKKRAPEADALQMWIEAGSYSSQQIMSQPRHNNFEEADDQRNIGHSLVQSINQSKSSITTGNVPTNPIGDGPLQLVNPGMTDKSENVAALEGIARIPERLPVKTPGPGSVVSHGSRSSKSQRKQEELAAKLSLPHISSMFFNDPSISQFFLETSRCDEESTRSSSNFPHDAGSVGMDVPQAEAVPQDPEVEVSYNQGEDVSLGDIETDNMCTSPSPKADAMDISPAQSEPEIDQKCHRFSSFRTAPQFSSQNSEISRLTATKTFDPKVVKDMEYENLSRFGVTPLNTSFLYNQETQLRQNFEGPMFGLRNMARAAGSKSTCESSSESDLVEGSISSAVTSDKQISPQQNPWDELQSGLINSQSTNEKSEGSLHRTLEANVLHPAKQPWLKEYTTPTRRQQQEFSLEKSFSSASMNVLVPASQLDQRGSTGLENTPLRHGPNKITSLTSRPWRTPGNENISVEPDRYPLKTSCKRMSACTSSIIRKPFTSQQEVHDRISALFRQMSEKPL